MLCPGASWGGRSAVGPLCPAYLWIAYGPQIKEKDGSLTQRFYIQAPNGRLNETSAKEMKLTAFYLSRRARAKGPSLGRPLAVQYQHGAPYLDINIGRFSRIELHVSAACGRQRYRATTVIFLFGKSGKKTINPLPPSPGLRPPQPYIHLRPERGHYWMQTGQNFRFVYQGGGKDPGMARVMEDRRTVGSIALDPQGAFSYTPPHDPKLDRAEPSAFKQTVLLLSEATPQGTVVSTFTLLLHRSRYGRHQMLPGLALFALVGFGVLWGVLRKRRRPLF